MAKYTGIVKWFDSEKGNEKDLHEGESVGFDIVQSEKGPSAINVSKFT